MDLQANTGQNDANSIYGGLLRSATDIGRAALERRRPAAAPAPAPAPAASFDWQKYLPLAIGAVVVLAVLGFVFKRK